MTLHQLCISLALIGFGLCASAAFALTPPKHVVDGDSLSIAKPVSMYRQIMQVEGIDIVVPTVVEVGLTQMTTGYERPSFMVWEHETGRVVPSYFKEQYSVSPTLISAEAWGGDGFPSSLVDDDFSTGVRFELPEEGEGSVNLILRTSGAPVLSSSLTLNLTDHVALPTSIEIRAYDAVSGVDRIVLSQTRMTSEQIEFIPTTASVWYISLRYAQPLEIMEAKLLQDDPERTRTRNVRFLAQPQSTYSIYYDADRTTQTYGYGESGDLMSDSGVIQVSALPPTRNNVYIPADVDGDGVQDIYDNCVMTTNTNQTDIDGNGRGDVCDDFDRDGRINSEDNCINFPNRDQLDEDGDGIGNVCDTEESRLTERLPWVPWVGMGIAGIVIVSLFLIVALRPVKPRSESDLES